jgi:aminoglycoside phosphotransferase (APT) family kinase protein
MASLAAPGCGRIDATPLEGGLRNCNLKLTTDRGTFVLRVYEHHASLCHKEVDLLRFVDGRALVPEVIYAAPDGMDEMPPFAVLRFVEGITFQELKRAGDADATAEAAESVGAALAAIGRVRFDRAGWIGPGPAVGAPLLPGENALPRFVDLCLESEVLRSRMPEDFREQAHAVVWGAAAELAALDGDARLVHCDFGTRNVIVRRERGRWGLAAVLDWEFAVAGSPLTDVGHFLRYDKQGVEAAFLRGFVEAGGELREGWRRMARLIDFSALCDILTREWLPSDVVAEVGALAMATVRAG